MAATTDTLRSDGRPKPPPGRTALVELWPPAQAVHALGHGLTFGRGGGDVSLDRPGISRRHARVERDAETWRVVDLESRNGSFVNGIAAGAPAVLRDGDLVRFGPCLLLVVDDADGFRGWRRGALAGPIVGGPAMDRARTFVSRVAASDLELLLVGETGTGKDVVATAVHQKSGVPGPLVSVNCAAVPSDLFESAFFGHRRGAFTGAQSDAPGYFRAAHDGTLFLDEIGDLALDGQAKLLRAIESGEVQPVGAAGPERVRTRIIAATNRPLEDHMRDGTFRRDLFERLGGTALWLPPLRERREDVVLLIEHFLGRHAAAAGPPAASPTVRFVEEACLRAWPGNARQLERAVREALVQARADGRTELEVGDLPVRAEDEAARTGEGGESGELGRVAAALRKSGGNVARAARTLGMGRRTVYAVLERHGRDPGDFRQ